MEQQEAKLKAALKEAFERLFGPSGWCMYLSGAVNQKKGIPDQLFAWGGTVALIEGKATTDVSPLQAEMFGRMARTGLRIFVLAWDMDTRTYPKASRVAWLYRYGENEQTCWRWEQFETLDFWAKLAA